MVGPPGRRADVLDQVHVRAHLAERVIDDISSSTHDGRLAPLPGSRVGPGFRSTVGSCFPRRRSGPACCTFCSTTGSARRWSPDMRCNTRRSFWASRRSCLPAPPTPWRASARASRADASLVAYAKRNGTIPSVHGPVAPPLDIEGDGLHAMEPLRRTACAGSAGSTCDRSTPTSADFDAHFRDSHVDGDGVETIVHEYTVVGSVDMPREQSARSPRPCGCCLGRSAPAPSEVPHTSAG